MMNASAYCLRKWGMATILRQSRRGTYDMNQPFLLSSKAVFFELGVRNPMTFSVGSPMSCIPAASIFFETRLVIFMHRFIVFWKPSRPSDSKTAHVAAADAPLLVPARVY